MGVDKRLAFLLALTESLISDERTNEVKDPNMTPRASKPGRADMTQNIIAMALSLVWVSRVHSHPVGLLP